MNQPDRIRELKSYNIMDSEPEKELDEISELASLICDVPISLITLLDEKRQWFKSKKGLNITQTPLEDSFCQHTLHKPEEVLVVNDSHKDRRFKNNILVLEDPKIRFYAGAPLKTKGGNVLGTLCIIDRKPREISENQKKALEMLAKKAMDHLEWRKVLKEQSAEIKLNAVRLTKLTQNIPAGIFQLRVSSNGKMKFEFLSAGLKQIHPTVNYDQWMEDPNSAFSVVHKDDISNLRNIFLNAAKENKRTRYEYRVLLEDGLKWHSIIAQPEKINDNITIFYGCITDVTVHREYENTLEEMTFDISHVLRHPVTSLAGILELIDNDKEAFPEESSEYIKYLKEISKELESLTRNLDKTYHQKRISTFS